MAKIRIKEGIYSRTGEYFYREERVIPPRPVLWVSLDEPISLRNISVSDSYELEILRNALTYCRDKGLLPGRRLNHAHRMFNQKCEAAINRERKRLKREAELIKKFE